MPEGADLTSYVISLDNAVRAVTSAIDLVGIDEIHHGKRVAVMAQALADAMDWPTECTVKLFRAALLHDCGVSKSEEHRELVSQMEWEGAQDHCRRGHDYLTDVPYLSELAPVVLWHHTRWCDLPADLPGDIAEMANLIYLADRIDALRAQLDVVRHPERCAQIMKTIADNSGTIFNPVFVAAAEKVGASEAFWFAVEDDVIEFVLDGVSLPRDTHPLSWPEMRQIGLLFARIIDAKSQFTAEHSVHVAALARLLAELMGLSAQSCRDIELAGLLHDLGKLRIPDAILEKQDRLDVGERRIMTRHAFATFMLLRRLFGDHPIANWASWHHETLIGTGYPFHRSGKDLPLEARIIAVSDVFQALLQDRPYRRGMDLNDALAILENMVERGLLDADVTHYVKINAERCAMAATGRKEGN